MWFGAIALALLAVQRVGASVFFGQPAGYDTDSLPAFLSHWVQFDGHRYLDIANSGYSYNPGAQSTIAWFPMYPIAIRGGQLLGFAPITAAVGITLIAGAASAAMYFAWLHRMGMSGRTQWLAWFALMLYPYAWYLYGIVYSDGLFLCFVLACFTLIEKERPIEAGVIAALASATRSVGIALVIGAWILHLERSGVLLSAAKNSAGRHRAAFRRFEIKRGSISWGSFAPLLGLVGLGAYITYLGIRFGAPLAFISNQHEFRPGSPLMNLTGVRAILQGWSAAGLGTIVAVIGFGLLAAIALVLLRSRLNPRSRLAIVVVLALVALVAGRWHDFVQFPSYRITTAAQGLICLVVFCSVPGVARRFGLGYAVFVGVLVTIPTLSLGDFMGSGRYLIAAFPVAALWGERLSLSRRPTQILVLTTSGILLAAMSLGFARGMYLS